MKKPMLLALIVFGVLVFGRAVGQKIISSTKDITHALIVTVPPNIPTQLDKY